MRLSNWMRSGLSAVGVAVFTASIAIEVSAEDLHERGAYLVNTIGACGNCHTPKDQSGRPLIGMALSGGFEFDDPGIGHVVVPNITPDPETGIGNWSEAQIVTALRNGKRPDGTIIGPPMPIPVYRQLSDRDAAAIATYLRSLKPIRNSVARTRYKIALPSSYGPTVIHVEEPLRTDRVAYGSYLAGPIGHCVLCHTAPGGGKPFDMSRAYAGGRELPDFGSPGALTVSRNITSDSDSGIGKWTDGDIIQAIVAGIRPDGTRLARTMPFDSYAKIALDDLNAIVAYLRALRPIK